jgi:hypothetical protein
MLGDITKRGFVVADALMIDLEELWECQTAVAKDERQIDPPTLATELDGQFRESPRTLTSWDNRIKLQGRSGAAQRMGDVSDCKKYRPAGAMIRNYGT